MGAGFVKFSHLKVGQAFCVFEKSRTHTILVKRVFNYYQPYILGTLKYKTNGTFALDPYPTSEQYKFFSKLLATLSYKKMWGMGRPPQSLFSKNY